jgi:predicted DNA-binding transcriptional regulator AlpA
MRACEEKPASILRGEAAHVQFNYLIMEKLSQNPFALAFIEALKDPETQDTFKKIFTETLKEISSPVEPEEDLIRMAGAMQLTGFARQTIYDRIHKSTIPHFKKGGRLYFSKSALRDWIKNGK